MAMVFVLAAVVVVRYRGMGVLLIVRAVPGPVFVVIVGVVLNRPSLACRHHALYI